MASLREIKPVEQPHEQSLPSKILVAQEPKAEFVNQPIKQHLR